VIASELNWFLVGSINYSVPCKQTTFFVRKGDTLRLYLVFQYENEFFAGVDSFYSGGALFKTIKTLSQPLSISWYKIQPKLQEYSNLWTREDIKKGHVHLEPIDYKKTPLPGYVNKKCLDVFYGGGEDDFGTCYVTAEITWEKKTVHQIKTSFSESSPLNQKHPFKIVQIVRRKDDTYIGYLAELFNTPFIIAPMVTEGGYHETDMRMGSDCAAFAIYGKRREGYRVPYCGPRGIYKYLTEIEKGALWPKRTRNTEIYENKDNQFVKVGVDGIARGDIVHFGEQVSVFYEDLGLKGFLDKDDLLFQCYKDRPYITSIATSGFYQKPLRIFSWKNDRMKIN
jgi:hypothetical protein